MADIVSRVFAIIQSTYYRLIEGQQHFTVIQIAQRYRTLVLLILCMLELFQDAKLVT